MNCTKLMFLLLIIFGYIFAPLEIVQAEEWTSAKQIIDSFMEAQGMDIQPGTEEYEKFMSGILLGEYPELTREDSEFIKNQDELSSVLDYAWKYSIYGERYKNYDYKEPSIEEAKPPINELEQRTAVTSLSLSHNRSAAIDYAYTWSMSGGAKRNPAYPDFGSDDCTNFVSQAMIAGHFNKSGSGDGCKHENTSTEWYVETNPSPPWWCTGDFRNWEWSTSWSVPWPYRDYFAYQNNYAIAHGWTQSVATAKYYLSPGDVVQLQYKDDNDNWISYHTMIVTEEDENELYVTYHSNAGGNDEVDKPLSSIPTDSTHRYMLVEMKFPATFLPDIRADHNNWDSVMYIRNDSTETANVTINLYDTGGNLVETNGYPANYSIAPNAQLFHMPTLAGLSGWQGSAVVDASEDVSVIVESQYGTEQSVTNYNGITMAGPYDTGWGNVGTTIYVPAVKRSLYGRTGQLYIFNTGSSSATVTPSFRQKDNGSSYSCSSITIPAQGRHIYHPSNCGLPSNQFYGAKLTSTQPLAVVLVEQDDSGNPRAATSNGFSTGNSPVYVPLVKSGWYGNNTGLVVQNVGSSSTTANVTFYDRDSSQTWSTSYYLNSLSSHSFWVPSTVPSGKVASARITAGQDLAATIYESKSGQGWRMQYNGFLIGSNTVILPRILKTSSWNTGFQVQNVGGANASVTVRYYDTNGNTNSSWNQTATIGPNKGATFAQSQHTALPNSFYGSAIITSDQPIVAEVNFAGGSSSNDKAMSYSGFNR